MDYAGLALVPLVILLFVLIVLAIFMPYFVYRMCGHLKDINHKMDTLINLNRR